MEARKGAGCPITAGDSCPAGLVGLAGLVDPAGLAACPYPAGAGLSAGPGCPSGRRPAGRLAGHPVRCRVGRIAVVPAAFGLVVPTAVLAVPTGYLAAVPLLSPEVRGEGCRTLDSAIGVPSDKVDQLPSVGHTGNRCVTCPYPVLQPMHGFHTTHAAVSAHRPGCATPHWARSLLRQGLRRQPAVSAAGLERDLRNSGAGGQLRHPAWRLIQYCGRATRARWLTLIHCDSNANKEISP
ncbi:hypothetical protein EV147_3706 [Cupriavidus agavae]|uniref:Uncharacterized protein n=1 Tax=Cupriavidus agavae TaxID=1001822 RepID=A0A4Q7RTD3_9BURK|nr:hypothetical protein EV147_3706 [Cupriavidus agavae]